MKTLWLKNGRVVFGKDGLPILCDHCPCTCEPKTLYSFSVDGRESETAIHDLSAWTGPDIGWPGAVWRLLELSDCYVYASGPIGEDGTLQGLPARFESHYHYLGRMVLQQGCIDEFGVVRWPPSGDCDNL